MNISTIHNRVPTETIALAMDALARDIQSDDGVANRACAQAAERLRQLDSIHQAAKNIADATECGDLVEAAPYEYWEELRVALATLKVTE